MFRHGQQLIRCAFLVAAAVAVVSVTSATAAAPRHFSQTAIAGVKLGMTKAKVKAILGKSFAQSGTYDNPGQPDGWKTLVFRKAEVSVYFAPGSKGAVMVTTWNRNIRNARGVGPCTKISKLKALYGDALQKSSHNTDPQGVAYGYTLGKHLLIGADGPPGNPSKTVTAVGLYDGTADMQGYAGFVTLSEQNCF